MFIVWSLYQFICYNFRSWRRCIRNFL